MKRTVLAIANWKMNVSLPDIDRFFKYFSFDAVAPDEVELLFCPSFIGIEKAAALTRGTRAHVGAQDVYTEEKGAFTGAVSARQIVDAGCTHVIVGHSERRRLFGETDELVARKVQVALTHRLSPIICLGESFAEKEAGKTKLVVERQVRTCLGGLRGSDVKKAVVAYEPVWAISTSPDNPGGVADSPESAQVVHKLIRKVIEELYGESVASVMRIAYGGSVDAGNVASFTMMDDIDGVLVGSASKEAESFQKIVSAINKR
ncbi:MAG: triose-phosphate isomerase [Patescibacteria group bacterium]